MATVLVVDDDAVIRQAVRAALEDARHAVLEADSGERALETLRATQESLVVLLDLRMPGVNGFDLLREVEHDPDLGRRHTFILLSGDDQSLPVVRALRSATILAGISKPFDVETLLATVAQAETVHMRPGVSGEDGRLPGGSSR
ncbi:MAG TPA: response regulator [Ktedonobacterales bacterium]